MKNREDFNILIVDDEEELVASLKTNFELEGYRVFTAFGGYDALEIVNSEEIDFVLSDIRMPEGDGEMLLKKLQFSNPEIPVVLIISGF